MPLPDALRRWAVPLLLTALLPAAAGVCVLRAAGNASQHETASQKAWALADQAREIARTGAAREALPLYRAALDLAPEIPAIRRDYAVVLGWAERFSEAKEQFQRVLEYQPDQRLPFRWRISSTARNAETTVGSVTPRSPGRSMTACNSPAVEACLRWTPFRPSATN